MAKKLRTKKAKKRVVRSSKASIAELIQTKNREIQVAKEALRLIKLREEGLAEIKQARELIADAYQLLNGIQSLGADVRNVMQDYQFRAKELSPGQLLYKIAETERRLGRLEGLLKDLPAL